MTDPSHIRVYRAPMRSRRDDIDPSATLARALSRAVCGFGAATDDRVHRFAAVENGSLVWARDSDGLYWLGRIDGPYRYDPDGAAVDLLHIRPCTWVPRPFTESATPAAVIATYGRGGRNFQQIHHPSVGAESQALWR